MKTVARIFAAVMILTGATVGHAALALTWNDLVPPSARIEDPLDAMSDEEREEVEWFIYLRDYLPAEVTPETLEFHQELNEALPRLRAQGIDVDAIIAERRARASALNFDLDGQRVTLSGYLLPLDLSGRKITQFLLVPYVGACIHVPPPPPNQIVQAMVDPPITYDINTLFKPVSVTGRLTAQRATADLFLVDGSAIIDIGYIMEVETVGEYEQQ
jgi:hypothetical protein